jgi:GMP synthase (glutamine-hydrolysing)
VTRARLLVIQHEDEAPLGWFDSWFAAAGAESHAVAAHRGEPVPTSLDGYDGLVVLGGAMGAYDDEDHPWLAATKTLIAQAVTPQQVAGWPFLGICLGHQLAAVALGGKVTRNPHGHSAGLTPFSVTAAGHDDALLGGVDAGAPAIMWNNDVVTRLPDGAVALAMSPDGTVQAARFAPLAWGVQFHPEASPDIFDGWTIDKPSAPDLPGIDVPAAAATIRAAERALRRTWEPVARRFAALAVAASSHPSNLDLSGPDWRMAPAHPDTSRTG